MQRKERHERRKIRKKKDWKPRVAVICRCERYHFVLFFFGFLNHSVEGKTVRDRQNL